MWEAEAAAALKKKGSSATKQKRTDSAPFELRLALLQERTDAFGEIFGAAGLLLRLALGVELLLVGIHRAVPIEAADETQGDRRPVRQFVRERHRLVHQRAVVIDAIDQAPFERLLGRQFFAEQRKFFRARQTDQTRQ